MNVPSLYQAAIRFVKTPLAVIVANVTLDSPCQKISSHVKVSQIACIIIKFAG